MPPRPCCACISHTCAAVASGGRAALSSLNVRRLVPHLPRWARLKIEFLPRDRRPLRLARAGHRQAEDIPIVDLDAAVGAHHV